MDSAKSDSLISNLPKTIDDIFSSGIDPIEHLKKLDYPKRAGTEGNSLAAKYITSSLTESGYSPIIQEFHYKKSSRFSGLRFPALILCWGVLTLLNIVYFSNFWAIGLITLALPYLSLIVLLRFEPVMKFFFRRRDRKLEDLETRIRQENLTAKEQSMILTSQNVIAEIGEPDASNHVLFTAHFDSISSKLPMKFSKMVGILGLVSFLLFSLLYEVNLIGELFLDWDFSYIVTPVFVIMLLVVLILLEGLLVLRKFLGNESHGLIDDGTGVAILLELAKFVKTQEITDYRFSFGFFSAEEAGLIGSSYYHRNSTKNKNLHVISVDMIGEKPPLAYVKGINPVFKTKMSSEFNEKLVSIAKVLDIEIKGRNFIYPGSDFAHWLYRGHKTNWLINGSEFIHSKHDNLENVNTSLVMDALKLLIAYLILITSSDSHTILEV